MVPAFLWVGVIFVAGVGLFVLVKIYTVCNNICMLISEADRKASLYRLFPDVRGALTIVKPDTVTLLESGHHS